MTVRSHEIIQLCKKCHHFSQINHIKYIHAWLDVCLDYVNVPVEHMQAIQGQTEAGYRDLKLYSYGRWLGIFNKHYHTDMITPGTAFDELAGSTGWEQAGDTQIECELSQQTEHSWL